MFRLTEPSSGQNHNTGTFSECVRQGIPHGMGSHSLRTHWICQYYGFGL